PQTADEFPDDDTENAPTLADHLTLRDEIRELADGPDFSGILLEVAAQAVRDAIADPGTGGARHPDRPELAAGRAVHGTDAEEQNCRRHEERDERDALGETEHENEHLDELEIVPREGHQEIRPAISREQGQH